MNSIAASPDYFSSCSSESDNDSSSDSEKNFSSKNTIDSNEENLKICSHRKTKSQNFLSKLLNREVSDNVCTVLKENVLIVGNEINFILFQ